ncbi:MAG: flagellar basal body P-ring protein FlgI [Leptospiraceae bacterium]|nr:flagellar basal body P-ring protein FlgI [Leptospiraceae bacterium]
MVRKILFFTSFFYCLNLFSVEVKLKDIARISGLRDNQISGYGIVVGLANSGDTKSTIALETLKNYLKNKGISSSDPNLTKNIAAVMVTANIPVYSKPGDKIDVVVSSIGDAKSLEGGVLLQSPLKAANGKTIAVASGVISMGGKEDKIYSVASRTRPKTTGTVQGGGIVEMEVQPGFFTDKNQYKIVLENQDFATLDLVNKSIKETFSQEKVGTKVVSPVEIEIEIPENVDHLSILARLENIQITPESRAKVVINERTGTIVMGSNVAIDEVAISKQGLSVLISKPTRPIFTLEPEKSEHVLIMPETTKVSDLVKALNKVGATTKDIIAILEGLKKSGALHAEVIVQ